MDTPTAPRTTLLEVDWQGWIAELGHDAKAAERARLVRAHARAQAWPVICSRYLSPDPDDPGRSDPTTRSAAFLPGLGAGGDPIVTKKGRDVFEAPELEEHLNRLEPSRVFITGLLTDHGVELAARGAIARGLSVTVVGDACAGSSPAAHDEALQALADSGVNIVSTVKIEELS